MKQNKQSTRAMRQSKSGNKPEGASKYALKRKSGRMMYGPTSHSSRP